MEIIKLTEKRKQILIDEAIEQIKADIAVGDVTAIDELLKSTPLSSVIGFLAEGDAKKYMKE